MNRLVSSAVAATPVPAAWDLVRALQNAKDLGIVIGGAILAVIGVAAVVVAVVFLCMKLMSEQSRRGWMTIIGLFVLGGLMLAGGITLFISMAEGSKTTIDQLGAMSTLAGPR